MPRRKNNLTVTAALRTAINESELSFKQLEAETGVLRQSLMKFSRGETSLRLDIADRLMDYFGLTVVKEKRK